MEARSRLVGCPASGRSPNSRRSGSVTRPCPKPQGSECRNRHWIRSARRSSPAWALSVITYLEYWRISTMKTYGGRYCRRVDLPGTSTASRPGYRAVLVPRHCRRRAARHRRTGRSPRRRLARRFRCASRGRVRLVPAGDRARERHHHGHSSGRPRTRCSKVVFPAPLGPTRAVTDRAAVVASSPAAPTPRGSGVPDRWPVVRHSRASVTAHRGPRERRGSRSRPRGCRHRSARA